MKKLIVLISISITFQNLFSQIGKIENKHACEPCSRTFNRFTNSILNKKVDSVANFFTDSMKTRFRDYDSNSLKRFITLKWINNKSFTTSLKKGKYILTDFVENSFKAQITVNFKSSNNEDDGDNRIVYFIIFEKILGHYKIYFIDMAD